MRHVSTASAREAFPRPLSCYPARTSCQHAETPTAMRCMACAPATQTTLTTQRIHHRSGWRQWSRGGRHRACSSWGQCQGGGHHRTGPPSRGACLLKKNQSYVLAQFQAQSHQYTVAHRVPTEVHRLPLYFSSSVFRSYKILPAARSYKILVFRSYKILPAARSYKIYPGGR